jgi:hypothetical protein
MYKVDFPKISDDLKEFLTKRVKKKECPEHGKKARISFSTNSAIVTHICCESFAKTIGKAPQIHVINKTAAKIRGLVLNDFSSSETYQNAIIQLAIEKFTESFKNKIEIEDIEFLSQRERKNLLKTALDIYSENSGKNIDVIWGQFCNLLKIRNCLAHWPTDTQEKALKLMFEKGKITFVKIKMLQPTITEEFDISRANKVIDAVSKLTVDLLEPFYFFRNK